MHSALLKPYFLSLRQVTAITGSAEYCEQHVAYACRMSRLLNKPGKEDIGVCMLIVVYI